MLGFSQYRNISEAAPVETTPSVGIDDKINKLVDSWVAELKKSLFAPTAQGAQRGLWDRFKGSMANLWHGRYNANNPYYWQNKLGDDLGATESYDINAFSLKEYKILREMFDDLEKVINEDMPAGFENLRLNRLIDQKALELKNQLKTMLSSGVPASTEPMTNPAKKAAEEESPEEAPTRKPDPTYDHFVRILKSLVSADAISQEMSDNLEDLLNSDKPEERKAATEQIEKLLTDNMRKPDVLSDEPPPGDDVSKEIHKIRPDVPPTNGKAWTELNDAEQRAWDVYGGGLEDTPGKIDGCLNHYGVKKLPWLLRIGDPRRKLLADQEQGKLKQQDGSCAKAYSHWFRIFTSQNRLEEKGENLKTWSDVMARVQAIKDEHKKQKDFVNKHKAPFPIPDSTPEPTPMSSREQPTTSEPVKPAKPEAPRTADIEIPATAHTPDNALGEPMHRTAPMDNAPPMPPEEEKPKDFKTMKSELKQRIGSLSDEETKDQLTKYLKKSKTQESLDDLAKELEQHEKLQNDVMNFEWTLDDLTQYYKNKLKK